MSINHSYSVADDGKTSVMFNICGLDSKSRDVSALSASIYASCSKTGHPQFACKLSMEQLAGLHSYLDQYEMIKDQSVQSSGEFIQVAKGQEEIFRLLAGADVHQVLPAVRTLIKEKLSEDDVNTILGRKESLKVFEDNLRKSPALTELEWQKFFEENEWIFGYGLRYK